MADNAIISANDGQSTPVSHSFSPIKILDGSVAQYDNRAESFQLGRETLQLRCKSSKTIRTTGIDLRMPRVVEETVNGVAVKRVVDFGSFRGEVLVPLTWTPAQAKNLRVLGANLLLHAVLAAMADDGEFVW